MDGFPIMPPDTTNLIVNNNLDTNTSWGAFTLPPTSIQTFQQSCELHEQGQWIFQEHQSKWVFEFLPGSSRVSYRMRLMK